MVKDKLATPVIWSPTKFIYNFLQKLRQNVLSHFCSTNTGSHRVLFSSTQTTKLFYWQINKHLQLTIGYRKIDFYSSTFI